MLELAKKAGLIFAALVAALLIFMMATASHPTDADGDPATPVSHPSRHAAASPHRAPADVILIVNVAQNQDGTQLSLGSAGQTSPSSLAEIDSVLSNYSAEKTSVDLYLEVEGSVPFSAVQEVIDALSRTSHAHLHLSEKYLLTPTKSHSAEAGPE